ncbi:glycosyl transferase family 2 [Tenacibaculum soleae]|uniref:Glycosyl transferase family 2 n=1 Tax=Tenacibaculum soleae TaxID=447689 RepID=A0A1B9XXX8_9FLAO|nr:glycosyltransferase [Tenacibaculum soleae]OCK42418.1 glycosyl transferase family 2 [Tenacibaculum soleae]
MNNPKIQHDLIIVIPCYNEENRLPINQFKQFLDTISDVLLFFVNDGSSDKTDDVIEKLATLYPKKVKLLSLKQNVGKASAVKAGFNFCEKNISFSKIAYLDADLATTLEECHVISNKINATIQFAFGSRIAKIDTNIQRKQHRFFIGRFIATLISKQLDLKVYDTQCGCKVFSKQLAANVFKEDFISKWLFDVEIFHRLIYIFKKENIKNIAREIPLKSWIDADDSRVKMTYFFKLWFDLLSIKKRYKS